jgi:predicted Rossmann-fold nucleotide-binding protein
MKAGHEGPGREASFGASIRLPSEERANEVIAGDEKLVRFRYFFTRKIMFMKESDAFVVLPGGFGTMDEAFELLTLVQTG